MACCGVRAQVMNTSGGITGRFSIELNSLENSAVWVGADDTPQVRNGPFTKRRFMLKVVVFAKTGSGISQGRLPKQKGVRLGKGIHSGGGLGWMRFRKNCRRLCLPE
eukprot:COSAG06_NODE_28784_length_568_cov_0.955224_2_plen_106_part_01